MRTLLAGVAAVALMPMAVLAADTPLKSPIRAPVGFDRSGFYVGAHSGWAWAARIRSTVLSFFWTLLPLAPTASLGAVKADAIGFLCPTGC